MTTKLTLLTLITFFSFITMNVFSQVQNSSCPTDVNNDGITSSGDASLVAAQFGTSCVSGQPCPTDVNHNGITSNSDLSLVLLKIGQRCHVGIFDVSNAVYGSGYVDIPLSISSDDTIVSLDFAMKFNESKLTYSTINTLVSYSAFNPYAHFSTDDRTLRMTSFTSSHFNNDVPFISVRFLIGTGTTITTSDFNSIVVYLNGNTSGFILK